LERFAGATGQDRIETMIKGISFLRPASTPADFERLASFFSALGFTPGTGWDEASSRGASFLAPLGNLEFVDHRAPSGYAVSGPEVFVEVTQLEAVREAAIAWFRGHHVEPAGQVSASHVSLVTETDWKSRLFTVEPVAGHAFTFWEWLDPLKGKPIAIEGDLSASGMRFAIVVARWNAVITDRLLEGALDALLRSGAARRHIEIVRVPGAWEVPAAARTLAERIPTNGGPGALDGIITLGCLIRGETAHYEAIYNEVARGIGQSQQETGIPHAFGVLTCETLEQALNRAGLKAGNKGFEAAVAVIEMVSLRRKLLNSDSEGA
jgi:6,7-dimethyl-8-ribityllumazine synthase